VAKSEDGLDDFILNYYEMGQCGNEGLLAVSPEQMISSGIY
jgi:hypothetical protein